MRGAAQARLEGYAAPAWAPPRPRRRARPRPAAPWPGDVTPDALLVSEVADVPAWIDQRARPPISALGLAIAAVFLLDVSLVLFRLSWG